MLVTDLLGGFIAQIGGNGSGLVDGPFARAALNRPQGLAYCRRSDRLFVADTENHAVRCVDFTAGTLSTLAGNGVKGGDLMGGGQRGAQQLNSPWDVVLAAGGKRLLVAMAGQHQIWQLDVNTGACAAFSGTGAERNQNGSDGSNTAWAQPSGLSLTSDGKAAYGSPRVFEPAQAGCWCVRSHSVEQMCATLHRVRVTDGHYAPLCQTHASCTA